MIVTRNTIPPQENAVQSSSDNDIDHSSLKTSVSPTVPVSSENTLADDEVFHDTKDSLDDEEEEVNHKLTIKKYYSIKSNFAGLILFRVKKFNLLIQVGPVQTLYELKGV